MPFSSKTSKRDIDMVIKYIISRLLVMNSAKEICVSVLMNSTDEVRGILENNCRDISFISAIIFITVIYDVVKNFIFNFKHLLYSTSVDIVSKSSRYLIFHSVSFPSYITLLPLE